MIAPDPIPTRRTPKPAPTPAPGLGTPPKWQPNPIALWGFIALGVGRILLSGAAVVLKRRPRKK